MMGWVLRVVVSVIGRTLRWRVEDPAGLLSKTRQHACIVAFWHNRIFLMPYVYRRFWRQPEHERFAVLVSASRDGERIARVLDKFSLTCVRGSSSRRGREALRELINLVNDGYDAGITPDGPRGPRYHCQDGVISLAQFTQAPIVPMAWDVTRKIVVKSWDGFMIPLPFARATLRVAPPLAVPADVDDAQHEQKRLELENILKSLSA
jgi:lysophospholipid acyltransferase (LPLAT)-like uncharacterized protein